MYGKGQFLDGQDLTPILPNLSKKSWIFYWWGDLYPIMVTRVIRLIGIVLVHLKVIAVISVQPSIRAKPQKSLVVLDNA